MNHPWGFIVMTPYSIINLGKNVEMKKVNDVRLSNHEYSCKNLKFIYGRGLV